MTNNFSLNLKDIKFNPANIAGAVKAPASKSIAHRALICAALAENGTSCIYGIDSDLSEDIKATIGALRAMGVDIDLSQDKINVCGGVKNNKIKINCGESASTLRFLIPVAAALGIEASFTGEGNLPERPVQLYQKLLADKGVSINLQGGKLPLTVSGKLTAGKFYVPGDITSQFITGLLFALPMLDGDSEIILTSPLESEPYVDITINVLKIFGIEIICRTGGGYYISGNQRYLSTAYSVEGDFSQAAFFASAAAINGEIAVHRLNSFSAQGDYKIIELLGLFGAKIYFDGDVLYAAKGELHGINIDAKNIPDLVPILSVVAAYAEGETVIYNAGRLRFKESDRIHAIHEMLTAIGANVKEIGDGLIINGKSKLRGGSVKSFGDHRIAMSAAIASIGTEEGIIIDDMNCIRKSYPAFLDDFLALIK